MSRRPLVSRPVRAVLAAVAVALSVAGCVSMPTGGPVLSYPITQGTGTQNQNYVQIQPQPPGKNWFPKQIVEGFLTASASFGNYGSVADEYLTANGRKTWDPLWSAIVYKKGPNVADPVYSAGPVKKRSATVSITGTVEASLTGNGSYSVSSSPDSTANLTPFTLVQQDGQWRIDRAPDVLLLTSNSFANDYELRKLYFFDPMTKYLVPDPVYVPLKANLPTLVNGLVHDLVRPPTDWLSAGPTHTAVPAGTKVNNVTINGVLAVVNLGGSIAKAGNATTAVMKQVSAQLLWTLFGAVASGQTVQSVEVELNGTPWAPGNSQNNPVQRQIGSAYQPASGASLAFYYIDKGGYLVRQDGTTAKPVRIRHLGTQYTQLAVSPFGKYLALLSGNTLRTGPINGPLVVRAGEYTAMSWDDNDQLWVSSGDQLFMLRGDANPQQPLGRPVPVNVIDRSKIMSASGPFTGLRVAPDGVRMAIVVGGYTLYFGAIDVQQPTAQPGQTTITITMSQVEDDAPGAITGLTWYGPDNVITLTSLGSAVTEYPVSGGAPTLIPAEPDMETITASSEHPLIGGLPKGHLVANASLAGAWLPISSTGTGPVYPG